MIRHGDGATPCVMRTKGMWAKIVALFVSLFEIWSKLSDETKDKIINAIVEMFSEVFRKQYKDSKGSDSQEGEPV